MNNKRTFTPSEDALILKQPVDGISLKTLEKWLRTGRETLLRRAAELGVSLDINNEHDEPVDTRTRRRSDELVDPLLQRLRRVHGGRN
ncbi:MAG TPA: hypothetical protein VHT68_07825 [Pseudolabrys sp.]|jgi:ribosomal protein L13E|nr:hypothetical protein [Pseudolabrys sp.]